MKTDHHIQLTAKELALKSSSVESSKVKAVTSTQNLVLNTKPTATLFVKTRPVDAISNNDVLSRAEDFAAKLFNKIEPMGVVQQLAPKAISADDIISKTEALVANLLNKIQPIKVAEPQIKVVILEAPKFQKKLPLALRNQKPSVRARGDV